MSKEIKIESEVGLKVKILPALDVNTTVKYINIKDINIEKKQNTIRFCDPEKLSKEESIRNNIKDRINKNVDKSKSIISVFSALYDTINDLAHRTDIVHKIADIEIYLPEHSILTIEGNNIDINYSTTSTVIDINGNVVKLDTSENSSIEGNIKSNKLTLSSTNFSLSNNLDINANKVFFNINGLETNANIEIKANNNSVNYLSTKKSLDLNTLYVKANNASGCIR